MRRSDRQIGWSTLGRDRLLESVGLDVEFTRAEGDHVLWLDRQQRERRALDLVGGFGATLLGHNHPELTATLIDELRAGRPMLTQGSLRGKTRAAVTFLEQRLKQETGHDYHVMLLNTGAEAVEAALKHARLEFAERQSELADRLTGGIRTLRRRLRDGSVSLGPSFFAGCERVLGISDITDLDAFELALFRANADALEDPGVVVAVERGFHGKTLGALAATWNPDARLPFVRGVALVRFVRPTDPCELQRIDAETRGTSFELDLDSLELRKVPFRRVLAIIFEPVRGEGGVFEIEDTFLKQLAAFRLQAPEVPVIVDEIQSGLGRTGAFLESAARNIPADYLTLGKALGGGLVKISALCVRRERFKPRFTLLHTSTFAEDDPSSRVMLRALEIIQRDRVPERCREAGERLKACLTALKQRFPQQISAIRGRGLMLGIEFCEDLGHGSGVLSALSAQGLLTTVIAAHLLHEWDIRILATVGNRNVLRFEPSAYISVAEIERTALAFESVCNVLRCGDGYTLLRHLVGRTRPAQEREEMRQPVRLAAEVTSVRTLRSRVAFVAHLVEYADLELWDPSLARFTEPELKQLALRVGSICPPREIATRLVTSATLASVELTLIGIFMSAAEIERDLRTNCGRKTRAQVFAAYEHAREIGCTLVGFGGFTSIATMNCVEFEDDSPAVTTGNSLTVAMGYEAIQRTCANLGISLRRANVAIVGSSGNIGQVYARLLAAEAGRLTIVGRRGGAARLRSLAREIAAELARCIDSTFEGGELLQRLRSKHLALARAEPSSERLISMFESELWSEGLTIAEDLDALRHADIIVAASSSASPLIQPGHLRSDRPVVICDIAVPSDVGASVSTECPNVSVITGGLVTVPGDPHFQLPGFRLQPGQTYACTAETLLLGLSGVARDYSRGAVSSEQVREIHGLARVHGFELAGAKVTHTHGGRAKAPLVGHA